MTINTVLKYSILTGIAIIAFIPLYVANPLFFPFITGKGFAFRIIVEIMLALWLILILREKGTADSVSDRSVVPRVNLMTTAVTVFAIVVLIADFAGLNFMRSIWSNFERMEGFITIAHLFFYFLIVSSVVTSRDTWHKLFNIFLIAGGITAIYGLFQFFGWAAVHQGSTRVDASLGNSAYMAVYMLMNAFIAGYMAFESLRRRSLFWTYTILALFFSFIMFQTATRGTILGWIAAILVSCAIYAIWGREEKGQSKRSRYIAGGAIALVILSGIIFYFNRDAKWIQNNAVLGRLATISLSDTKTQARGFVWPMAAREIFSSPKTAIIGVGQENFNYIFNENYDPKMWAHEQWFDRAHSVFLDWLVAGGLLGLTAYLFLYVLALLYVWKSDLGIGQKSMIVGLIFGYAVHNVFVFDNQTSYVMFFTMLAFIHSLRSSKPCSWIKNHDKLPSEDQITIRDYILIPVIVLFIAVSLYFINFRAIKANTSLIAALQSCTNAEILSADPFYKVLEINQYMANQEAREQVYSCAGNVIRSQSIPEEKKNEFYALAKKTTEDHIKATPNDARAYIISGNFYNSIGEWATATPLLEKARELSPNKQSILIPLAINYINIGKRQEAVDITKSAYESAVENEQAKLAYISALILNNQESVAKEIFKDEPVLFTSQLVINAYLNNEQYSKVIEIYKALIVQNPNNPGYYEGLASAYMANGQRTLTIQTLVTASEKFPELKPQIDEIIKGL